MIDYLSSIADESERFLAAINSIGAGGSALDEVRVPSCPDWNGADLTWHLAEVQYFWATIVGGRLSSYADAPRLERPPDDELVALFFEQTQRLASVLAEGADDEACWSWHPSGGTIGWVRRRQAQEALIHRVDAELTAAKVTGAAITEIDETLATDGIDEMLRVMLGTDPLPDWGSFEASQETVHINVPQQSWDLTLGHVVGTNDDGPQRLPAIRVDDRAAAAPSATVTGSAAEIDLWLWRRGDLGDGAVRGNHAAVAQLQEIAAVQ